MNILFHTIAVEPARWTGQRVSLPLTMLLPAIAAAGFGDLEIYEPHLGAENESAEVKALFADHDLRPQILSSYLKLLSPETSDAVIEEQLERLSQRIAFYGFRKLRLFPGPRFAPTDTSALQTFSERLARVAQKLPGVEVLLETHDGSLADDAALLTRSVANLALPNVGLLYQPTVFQADAALAQFRLQKSVIRHLHLQNRHADKSFATMEGGVIRWDEIIREVAPDVDATLEFVPAGICPMDKFNLAETLRQARSETAYVANLDSSRNEQG